MSKMAIVPTKQHVRASFRDAVYTHLNIGMAEGYFCAFMLALGIPEVIAGLGTIIPQFIGVLFLLLTIRSFFRRYSLKKRILFFLGIQALTMIPLIIIGYHKINSPFVVIAALSMYWACLLSLNPPWNRLIGHTVPQRFRLKFFSIRNQFGQASVFIGLIGSGLWLFGTKDHDRELTVYVGIFTLGFILKCLSWYEIQTKHNDYDLPPGSEERVRLRDFLKKLRSTEQGKLVSFLFFFYITVHFAAPYFNPYMLGQLKFNYLEYMVITAIAYFGRVFSYRLLQAKARSRHMNKILIFATIGISTSPLWWSLTQNFWLIMVIEFLSGCYWAGFELSTVLLYYQKIDDRERTSVITYITFLNTTGMIIGSLLGALFMKLLPEGFSQYTILFATATFLRILLIVFAPHVNFKGQIPKLMNNRIFGVLSPFGAISRTITGKNKKKED